MHFVYKILLFGFCLNFIVSLALPLEDAESEDNYDYEEYFDGNATSNGSLIFLQKLSNTTVRNGKTVKLRCEVKNLDFGNSTTKIRLTWKKFNAPLQEDERISVKTIEKPEQQIFVSRLKILKAETSDKGSYSCIVSNGVSTIESQGILDVVNETFSRNDVTTSSYSKSSSTFVTTIEKSETTSPKPLIYNTSQPFCQLYEGEMCKEFLAGKFVFIQPPYTQRNIEEKLENSFLVISQSNDISSSCSVFAKPSLCYSAFPICMDPKQTNGYQKNILNKVLTSHDQKSFKDLRNQLSMFLQRICKEDCDLLENELCRREYAIAKRHPVIGQTLELEECQFLPEDTEKNSRYCLRLGVERAQNVNEDDNCFWDFGELYRGVYSTGISGDSCIRWSHQFNIPLSEYPELSGHAYCRNPGRQESEPFCFVEQNRKEICGIPRCARIIWLYILAIATSLTGCLLLVMCLYCCKRRRNQKNSLQTMNIPSANKNIYGNAGPNSPMELNTLLPNRINNMPPSRSHSGQKNGFQSVPHYTYKEVTFVEELGEGAFGKVYKGELKTKSGKIIVAVKSLKENASAKTQADFQREIELISELKHPNIICLLGVVIKQEPMCMLFEFMSEGDLHEFLITFSPIDGKCLTQAQFLDIAVQIAQGMEYLSDNHYVHRDLAARNCLVSQDLVVKISDFGLSRDMYSCDYYRAQSKSLLPVRWMPPESILYGKFTTESDVWSFGVVLWEIYSYGLQPYYGYNNQEVINMIRSRKLLPCPESCPSYCYALMVECWAELAVRRPSFSEIVYRLKMWKQNGSSSGAYFKTPEVHNNIQKHGTKSDSHPFDPSATWEKPSLQSSSAKLNESQSSLTSHTSSLGNRSRNDRVSRRSSDRHQRNAKQADNTSLERLNPKNTVVSSSGGSFQTKVTL